MEMCKTRVEKFYCESYIQSPMEDFYSWVLINFN